MCNAEPPPLCLCLKLQRGSKIIAIFQVIWGTILLVISLLGIILLLYTTSLDEDDDDDFKTWGLAESDKDLEILLSVIICGTLVTGTLTTIFAFLLYKGATHKKSGKIRAWLYVNFAVFLCSFVAAFIHNLEVDFSNAKLQIESESAELWSCAAYLIIHFYFILVAYSFHGSLRMEKLQRKRNAKLTQEEITMEA